MSTTALITRKQNVIAAKLQRGKIEIIDSLMDDWRELCCEGPCNEPFYRPEFIKAYLSTFEPEAEIVLATAWRGNTLRAVLPLLRQERKIAGVPVTVLSAAANMHSCRFDMIHGRGDSEEAGTRLWKLFEHEIDWDVMEVSDVPSSGGFRHLFLAASRQRFPAYETDTLFMPRINFHTESLLGEMPQFKSFRRRLKCKQRKLESRGSLKLRRIDTASTEWLENFYTLERSGWKGSNGTAIACHKQLRTFYDLVAATAAKHEYFTMYMLELDGRAIAMHYGLTLGDAYYVPKIAYDEAFSSYSPGQLLVMMVKEECKKLDLRRYELLGSKSDWKIVWANEIVEHKAYKIFSRGFKGTLLYLLKVRVRQWGKKIKQKLPWKKTALKCEPVKVV